MNFFERLKAEGEALRAKAAAEASKFKNRAFLEAVIAACAMLAAADGKITPDEKAKMTGFIQRAEELKHFNMTEVIQIFGKYADNFDFDLTVGEAECLRVIGKLKGKPDQARLIVRIACAIGMADGDFDDDEKAAVRKIALELGLDPAEFDL